MFKTRGGGGQRPFDKCLKKTDDLVGRGVPFWGRTQYKRYFVLLWTHPRVNYLAMTPWHRPCDEKSNNFVWRHTSLLWSFHQRKLTQSNFSRASSIHQSRFPIQNYIGQVPCSFHTWRDGTSCWLSERGGKRPENLVLWLWVTKLEKLASVKDAPAQNYHQLSDWLNE